MSNVPHTSSARDWASRYSPGALKLRAEMMVVDRFRPSLS